ncbi:MAG: hypothetical protein M1426_02755 [Patescibacteria group bacterium]|nr:hypothetical protein [Patescibacteria group bacterium]
MQPIAVYLPDGDILARVIQTADEVWDNLLRMVGHGPEQEGTYDLPLDVLFTGYDDATEERIIRENPDYERQFRARIRHIEDQWREGVPPCPTINQLIEGDVDEHLDVCEYCTALFDRTAI